MPRGQGPCRHGWGPPQGGFGNLPRFIEPVVLYLLKKLGHAHGYQLAGELPEHAIGETLIDRGALYRTLRQLEADAYVTSDWDVSGAGPARRLYRLTPAGENYLRHWAELIERMAEAMHGFVAKVGELDKKSESDKNSG
ncbi:MULTISPECIES: PadR family transcriptional regulator [Syntrophotalea]|jgi:poly-beta-hydroxybutyrate-responsive repressor|uniref:PadR family transcriptional regulator n=1 Tax=Syntrophotalea acetylenica TaxID=29542 RepID=A0A1L3GED4_SYNAC|nr:helix-turn-helix transcriptional regulator [Syntrophotalea acetylenica]APG24314.1 PadR family transcriptional regulator [Syntrophotalea acetylenica]APG44897.1 PadR family transcriptional regulator [Syntrophotalea acetylenica]MDY0262579.1 helix-turn-helix transcriptional regulator [Syntrophotalea acetylenica]